MSGSVDLQRIRVGLGVWDLEVLSLELGIGNGQMEDKEDRERSLGAIVNSQRKLRHQGY